MKLFRILDPFTLTLITVVLLASFFPARGEFVPFVEHLTTAAIALLFFMHGAKLSREAIIAGGSHWRLHLWVMCSTFIVFPVLGVLFAWWAPIKVDPMLYSGFIYLCILPATVQSAIAFTSLAGGNVAAAVCSASASSLLGIFVSPLLVGLLMHLHGAGGDLEQVGKIMLQLLLPFVLGHLSRPWIGSWVAKHKNGLAKPIRPRSCWWSTQPSAKPSSMESGTKWAWDRCCLSSLSAWCCWLLSSRSTFLSPAAAALASRMKLPSSSAARKRAWRTGYRWRISCSRHRFWG